MNSAELFVVGDAGQQWKCVLCLVVVGGSCRFLGGAAGIAERVTKLSFFFVVYTGFEVRGFVL